MQDLTNIAKKCDLYIIFKSDSGELELTARGDSGLLRLGRSGGTGLRYV